MLRVVTRSLRSAQGKLQAKEGIWLPSSCVLSHQTNFDSLKSNASRRVRWVSQATNVDVGAARLQPKNADPNYNVVRSEFLDIEIPKMPFADFVWQNISEFGDRTALTCGMTGRNYTYEMVQLFARKLGSALIKRGMRKGDVLGLVCPNIPEFPITFLGVTCIGGIVSPVNPTYTAVEIARQFQDSGAKFVVTVPPMADKVKDAVAHCPLVEETFVIGEAEGLTPLASLAMDAGDAMPDVPSINVAEDILVLPYSSGTTGLPKGVMLTHQNLTTNILQATSPEIVNRASTQDTVLAILPMFHSYALTTIMGMGLHYGARIVTLPRFDADMFLKALHEYKPTIVPLVPPILNFLTLREDVNVEDLRQIHSIFCGAAPLSKSLVTSFMERIHPTTVIFQEGYGMTELSPVSHLCPKTSGRIGTCGVLIPNSEAKVVDLNTGESVGTMSEGELCVRGPQVMKGYLNNQKATDETIDEDGWLHTGDIAIYDDEGYFQVIDRLKELIKVKGLQVAPSELEDLILSHPNVEDVAVIGVPDDHAGELPRAYIVPSGRISKDELNNFVNSKVAPHKQLKGGVEFVKSIPKTQTGKILRRELREQVLGSRG